MIFFLNENIILQFKLLNQLMSVSVIAFFPWWVVDNIKIITRTTIHVVTARSAFMHLFPVPSQTILLEILGH